MAVVDEVYAGADRAVGYAGVGGDVGAPLSGVVSDKVVHLAGQLVVRDGLGAGVGADELHADD